MSPGIHVAADLKVSLSGYLGPAFDAFRAATEGMTSRVGGAWVTAIPQARLAATLGRLRAIEGVALTVDQSVTDRLVSSAAEAESIAPRVEDAIARLEQQGCALYQHQREGIGRLIRSRSLLLADDMGLGKTLQILAAAEGRPLIVVCPAVARGVWRSESLRWTPGYRVDTLSGRGSFRWPAPGELVITNYEILCAEAGIAPHNVVVVFDEAQKIKSPKAAMTKRARALAAAVRTAGGSVWLATGTPLMRDPRDLWSLIEAGGLTGHFAGKTKFMTSAGGQLAQQRIGGGRTVTVWEWTGRVQPSLAQQLAGAMLRRRKADVLDLPAKRRQTVEVNGLSKSVVKQLDDVASKYEAALRSGELPPFEATSAARRILEEAKLPALRELVEQYEEAGEPLITMSWHRSVARDIGSREGWGCITGETPAEERTRLQDRFQAGELIGLACTIRAAGTALTLTRASHVIFSSQSFSPADNLQAEDRIYRIGQTAPVLVQVLVAGCALDRRLAQIIQAKIDLIGKTVEAAADATPEPELGIGELLDSLVISESPTVDMAALADDARARRLKSYAERRAIARRIEILEDDRQERRSARTETELWAGQGLLILARACDGARSDDGQGFARSDVAYGQALASMLPAGLTDLEWHLTVVIASKYRRTQIPREAE